MAWEAKSNGNTPCTSCACCSLGISALREGDLRLRLDEERDALLTIKRGERPWPDVNAWRLRLHKEFDEAFASTQLPERPDYAWANEFLLKARRAMR